MNIGANIRQAREAKGLTQEELGKKCGTTKQTIFKYENGIVTNIPMGRLEKIADVLEVSPAYLMGWKTTDEELLGVGDAMEVAMRQSFANDEYSRIKRDGSREGLPLWCISACTPNELQLMVQYWRLNDIGKAEAEKRMKELGALAQYVSEAALNADKEFTELENYVATRLDDDRTK